MNPQLRSLFRTDLLRLASKVGANGLRAESLHTELRAAGYHMVELAEVQQAVRYWRDKALMEAVDGGAGPFSERYRVTAQGQDFLDAEGGAH